MPIPAGSSFIRLSGVRPRIAAAEVATFSVAAATTPAASLAGDAVLVRDHRTRVKFATPVRAAATTRWALDPSLILKFHTRNPYKKREELTVPVSPASEVNDRLLFEGAQDPSQKFYLPCYTLAEESVMTPAGTSLRYRFKLTAASGDKPGSLSMHLLRVPPPGIDVAASNATPMAHEIAIFLRFYRPLGASGSAEDRRAFTSWTQEADGTLLAVLDLPRLADSDTVHMALTHEGFRPEVVVTRTATVGVPVTPQPAEGPMYRQTGISLDGPVEPRPFLFPENHPAFEGIVPSREQAGLVRRTSPFKNRHFSYYQDQLQRDVFFHLPDEIRIARGEETPHEPTLSVRFESTDGKPEDIQAVMEIVSVPVIDPGRLAAAATELAQFCPGHEPRFAPLPVGEGVRFRLGLPGSAAFQDRPDARVDLARGIVDSVRLPLASFQSVYDALFGASSVLLQGEVVVDLGDGPDELVPFVGRMDRLAGDPLVSIETYVPETGGVQTILRNVTESPVEIRSLQAALDRGEERVVGTIQGLDLASPVTLPSGGEVSFVVLPSSPLGGEGPADAVFDLSGVKVLPDPAALWSVVLDPATPATYTKSITVRSLASLFHPPTDRPDEAIGALTVEFQGGETVELNETQLTSAATLRLPIADLILRRADEGAYRYRVRVIRTNGQSTLTDWITDTTTILFPDVRK